MSRYLAQAAAQGVLPRAVPIVEAMAALVLSSHRHARVTVDHCGGCRLVWFDALESVQLDALGWVRLLRNEPPPVRLTPSAIETHRIRRMGVRRPARTPSRC